MHKCDVTLYSYKCIKCTICIKLSLINGMKVIKHLLLLGHSFFYYNSIPYMYFLNTNQVSYLTGNDEITVVCAIGICS